MVRALPVATVQKDLHPQNLVTLVTISTLPELVVKTNAYHVIRAVSVQDRVALMQQKNVPPVTTAPEVRQYRHSMKLKLVITPVPVHLISCLVHQAHINQPDWRDLVWIVHRDSTVMTQQQRIQLFVLKVIIARPIVLGQHRARLERSRLIREIQSCPIVSHAQREKHVNQMV